MEANGFGLESLKECGDLGGECLVDRSTVKPAQVTIMAYDDAQKPSAAHILCQGGGRWLN